MDAETYDALEQDDEVTLRNGKVYRVVRKHGPFQTIHHGADGGTSQGRALTTYERLTFIQVRAGKDYGPLRSLKSDNLVSVQKAVR